MFFAKILESYDKKCQTLENSIEVEVTELTDLDPAKIKQDIARDIARRLRLDVSLDTILESFQVDLPAKWVVGTNHQTKQQQIVPFLEQGYDRQTIAQMRANCMDEIRDFGQAVASIDQLNKLTLMKSCAALPFHLVLAVVNILAVITGGKLAILCGIFAFYFIATTICDLWLIIRAALVHSKSAAGIAHSMLSIHRGVKKCLDQEMGLY